MTKQEELEIYRSQAEIFYCLQCDKPIVVTKDTPDIYRQYCDYKCEEEARLDECFGRDE